MVHVRVNSGVSRRFEPPRLEQEMGAKSDERAVWRRRFSPLLSCVASCLLVFAARAATTTRLVPIVLDADTGAAHYTTELVLTNAEANVVAVTLRYTASLGSGSGSVSDSLTPGQQRVIPDILAYLRGKGLAIPAASTGQQAGTLLITFDGVSTSELVSATVRTTTPSAPPQPLGRAGLAYRGLSPAEQTYPGVPLVFGLRANATDRSNVAVFNSDPSTRVDVKITAFSGTGDGASKVLRDNLTLPPLGWAQVSFAESGFASGWAQIDGPCLGEKGCPVRAYGVINDNITNDGSFVNPARGDFTISTYVNVPALVETGTFRSELVLANASDHSQLFRLTYREAINPGGGQGTVGVTLGPAQQRIIPGVIQFLRDNGVPLSPAGSGSFVGSLYVEAPDSDIRLVYAAARTAAQSPAGGQFGLFTPELVANQAVQNQDAFIFGLRADENNRSNVAVFNFTDDSPGTVGPAALSLQVYDGDAGGTPAGPPELVTVGPHEWKQVDGILAKKGVKNGWVKIGLVSGTSSNHSWAAYGVINDGGSPGQRTGDGAYIEMERREPSANTISDDLLARVRAFRDRMPGATSEGFVNPTPEELLTWRSVVTALASGDYSGAQARLSASSLPYRLIQLTDTGYQNRALWALEENTPSQKGWGNLYVNPSPARDLGIEAPHPLFDTDTELEATDIFRGTAGRFLLIAGTHRCADAEQSSCSGTTTACGDGHFHVSDAGHFSAAAFQATHEVFTSTFPAIVTVNLHGNADSSCEDVFLSSGVASDPQPILSQLRDGILAGGGVTVGIAGSGGSACTLSGTTNVQGRFTNGAKDVCGSYASTATGRFVHIEQKLKIRTSPALYGRITSSLSTLAPATGQARPAAPDR